MGGCPFNEKLLGDDGKRVDFSGQPRDFSGRGILVENTLGVSLLD
jgi:hypothetical protein